MLTINIRKDLSLAQLAELHRAGGSVCKTPHEGNVYSNNLSVMRLGIPCVLYNRTLPGRDRNFHPERIIRGGHAELLTDDGRITTHMRVTRVPEVAVPFHKHGALVRDGHFHALKRALPQAPVETYCEYLVRYREWVLCVVEALTRHDVSLWKARDARGEAVTRYVTDDGLVHTDVVVESWDDVVRYGVFGVTRESEGLILPNLFNVFIAITADAWEQGLADIYHLSGPDMVHYIETMRPALLQCYEVMRRRCRKLPENLVFHLVPVASMRFGVVATRQHLLDELVEAVERFSRNESARATSMRQANSVSRGQLIAEVNAWRTKDVFAVRNARAQCPDPFYRIAEANAPTQYDVIDHGGWYVHPTMAAMPIVEVERMLALIDRMCG